jgi:uncharacterized protein YgiM (DUF1202 family)
MKRQACRIGRVAMLKSGSILLSLLFPLVVATLVASMASPGYAADVRYASKELNLRAAPRGDSATVATIPKNTRFEVIGEQASWAQISTGKQQGWVLFFYLIPEPTSNPEPMNEVKNSFGLLTGKQGTGQVTAVLGVRGLDEEQLKAAKFNADELKRLEALPASRQAAESFAREGRLVARKIEFLPAPLAATPQSQGGGRQ